MFKQGTHSELFKSLESIGASFAIFELQAGTSNFKLVSANTLYEEITEKPINECVNKTIIEILPRYVEKPLREHFQRCLSEQNSQEIEMIIERSGVSRWWRVIISPVLPRNQGCDRLINTCIEITDKKMLEKQLIITRQRFQAVIENAYDGIITIDDKQTIKLMNQAARDIFGVGESEVCGTNLSRFIPLRYRSKHLEYIASFRHSVMDSRPMHSRASVTGLRVDGTEVPLEVAISKIRVGPETEMTAVIRDISERARLIDELSRAATQDSLTGLYNRRFTTRTLSKELERCRRFNHVLSIVIMDLDNFKEINDTYGHSCGDSVLKIVAETLSKDIREIDTFCRWGGEEFVVLLPETNFEAAIIWAQRACALIASKEIEELSGQIISITASFGVMATYGKDETIDTLMQKVDKALYHAKRSGKNCVYGFE
ncbi:MAG: diguanylate cyclase [Gammaproteobacteria bacterium]|nr:diguanylate cyclase [Gammaproteobacteria bacterium]MCP5197865.1 diguanylate cyclase [Gammaproteobacteria bacterium]